MATLSDKDGQELFRLRRAVLRAEQALAEIDRAILLPDGICNSDVGILEHLARKGAQSVNGLGRRIGLTSGSVTVAVQRLRRRGLVETCRDSEDKRVVWVSATPDGDVLTNRFAKARGKILGRMFSDWSSRERVLLTNLLQRLRKTADEGVLEMGAEAPGA